MEQYYNITGLTVKMDSFGRTLTQAEAYRTEPKEPADIVIDSDWTRVKKHLAHLSDEDCAYLATGGDFYRQLLKFDGMMLHASAVVREGRAYLFSAPCGTGKSTHTALWRSVFSDAVILNDDKPALRREDGRWYAYGTPWSGKTDINENVSAPLRAMVFIERSKENKICPITPTEAFVRMIREIPIYTHKELSDRMMNTVNKIFTAVPAYLLSCDISKDAVDVVKNEIFNK